MKNFLKPQNLATRRAPRCEGGYALMMVVFFTALLLIATMVAGPRLLLEGKREKEKEMIWRGQQYVRGVKLYYRKMGRFPTTVDDLTKPKTGSLRFMRQAYKDPMNGEDGSWRLIYVGPAGQLIGSLKPPQSLQLPKAAGLGTPASTVATNSSGPASGSSAFGSSSGFGSSAANSGTPAGAAPGSSATSPTGGGGNTAQPGQSGATPSPDGSQPASADGSGAASSDAMSTPQAIVPTSTGPIIGGNIIGVGSKVSARSVIVYEKAKNYRLFEFIWDPSKDTTIAGQIPLQTGTGLGQNIGTNPSTFGQQPAATNPNPSQPGTTAPQSSPAPPLDSAPPQQQ
jgi:hypothetical protein